MSRSATGIDVGSKSAVVLRGHPQGNAFAVTDFWAAAATGGSPEEAWQGVAPPFRVGRASVALSGRGVNLRYTQVPRLADWQLRKLMRFEVGEIGGQAGEAMASDFNVLPELPEIEGEDVVLLAMARDSLLEEHQAGLAAIGGKLVSFTPAPIALYNAWLSYGVVEDDTVLVANVGHENVDVVLVRGTDLLFARSLAGGGRLFDAALSEQFGVSQERAERLKKELASLAPESARAGGNREKAYRAAQGAAGQLLSLLQSAVLFGKTQIKLAGLSVDRVALCGGGAALPGLDTFLAGAMRVPVEVFDPFRVVDSSALRPEARELLAQFRHEAVIALGLATGATRADAYAIELLPARVERRREFWGKTALSIAAGVLCVGYLGFAAYRQSSELALVRADVGRLSAANTRARAADNETRELVAENRELAELAGELWLSAGSGEQIARVLEALARALPDDFWLTELWSRRAVGADLGLAKGDERPVLHLEGAVREGVTAPAALFEGFLARLAAELEGARIVPSLSPSADKFAVDLTLVAEG